MLMAPLGLLQTRGLKSADKWGQGRERATQTGAYFQLI